ncbi:hypothetical protein C5167_013719 [Papaver somniferum]|uniref:DUF829 domain-containing protein n=1 Tax=Papaver somniferum TaxID=3469 RepID=A0A4Y7J5F0_PAPSO|nr:hypothetical protein C5167_013719 [Papaver somniferum]
MWGDGGKIYWGRKAVDDGEKVEGIVVVFAWLSSQEKNLKNYVKLYSSLGWNSLVCHPDFLNLWFPDKATSLASAILNELIKVLKVRPCPVVFAAFSGGPKTCMYKALQDDYQLVRNCISGQIYDSCPVDFTSDVGTKFVLHPTVLKMSHPPRIMSWIANGIASGLDTLFVNRFEAERADYWQTLYASVVIICNFAQRLQDLGGDVKLVKWNSSPHVGHYRQYPADYKAAVTELLGKAAFIYSRRLAKLEGEKTGITGNHVGVSESVYNLQKATATSCESFRRVAVDPSDHFFLPSSVELEDRGMGSMQDERKEELIHLQNLPALNAHGVLGQILFDVCVPKNIEGWDMKPSSSSSRKNSPFNPIKCIRRSRL